MKSRQRPKKKPTGDRKWIYEAIFVFISERSKWEKQYEPNRQPVRWDREIYTEFAPLHHKVFRARPTWTKKNRRVKREMIKAALRRLIEDGKIRVHAEETLNLHSGHGGDRRNIEFRRNLFGKEFDGTVRSYSATNVLQAIADALVEADA